MPLFLTDKSITAIDADIIVNAANEQLAPGGGVCGAIFDAAGKGLVDECIRIGHCDTGNAVITNGYSLRASKIIHTVGPIYRGGQCDEERKLASCYKSSILLAQSNGAATLAFPIISAGIYGYPFIDALKVAIRTISATLFELDSDMTVFLCIFGKAAVATLYEHFGNEPFPVCENSKTKQPERSRVKRVKCMEQNPQAYPTNQCCSIESISQVYDDRIDALLSEKDETFHSMLLRLIDESKRTDSEVYHAANIDRRLFSKIRSQPDYSPSKSTVLAFAVALELDVNTTEALLNSAGYSLSRSKDSDIIVAHYLRTRVFDVNIINLCLYARGLTLLGSN